MYETRIRPVGPAPCRLMIVTDYASAVDIAKETCFSDTAGIEFRRMLQEAGIIWGSAYTTAVVKHRSPGDDAEVFIAQTKSEITPRHTELNGKQVLPALIEAVHALKTEIAMVRPDIIIAVGNIALWALTGEWGVDSWRSSYLDLTLCNLDKEVFVIPTYHPRRVRFQEELRPITVHDLRRAAKALQVQVTRADYKFIIRPSFDTVLMVLSSLYEQLEKATAPRKLSVDIETRAYQIACIGIGWSPREAMCIPLMVADVTKQEGYWTFQEEVTLMTALNSVLTHRNVEVLGQNFLYDAQYFYRWLKYVPRLKRDTMIAQHSMFSNMPKGLDFLSSMYCEWHRYWKDEGKTWDATTSEEQLWEYNCKDCVITFEVDTAQQLIVDQMRVRAVHDFQQELFWPVLMSMIRGVRIDHTKKAAFSTLLLKEAELRQNWVNYVVGYELNIKSPTQLKDFFYQQLQLPAVKDRKTGSASTNEEALRKMALKEPLIQPLVNKILELRSLGVFHSTFVEAKVDTDERMRCSFMITGTDTYRFASRQNAFGSGLNFQNIPKGGEAGDGLELPNVRELYIPDPGMTVFDIDLSSADLRIVVWESDETEMKAMLAEGLDPYTEVAKEFYHDRNLNKKDPRRQLFKSFCHGTHYLGTAKGLAERLGLLVHEAERTQKWYFERFPRIKRWQDNLVDQIFKRKMVQNIFGYRMYFFCEIQGTVLNQAAAWIPQSTVGCLINRAWMNIYNNLSDVEVLIQVHDSLVGQFPTAKTETCVNDILRESAIVLPYSDPLVIPVGIKTSTNSWGDCE